MKCMKKPTNNLHRLIQKMTQAEKRYFKMHFAFSRSVLIELYDLINKMEVYDEEKVKAQLSGKAAKNLKVYKVQLLDLLLRSLVLYHQKRKIHSKIRVGMEEVDVLMSKQLYELAADRLAKVKQICLKYEEYTALHDVVHREFSLFHIREDKIGISRWTVYDEMGTYLEYLSSQHENSLTGVQLIDLQKQGYHHDLTAEKRQYYEQVLERLEKSENKDWSFRALLSRNIVRTLAYQALGNQDLEKFYRKKNIELFDEYPHFKDTLSFEYLAVLRNYANHCLEYRDFDSLKRAVRNAREFAKDSAEWEHQLIYFCYVEIHMFYIKHEYDYIKNEIEPQVVSLIEKFKLSEDRISIMVFALLAVTNIALKNSRQAHEYLQEIFKAPEDIKDFFSDIFMIIGFINHYQTNDEFLIEKEIATVKRKCSTGKRKCSDFFKHTIEFFRVLIASPTRRSDVAKSFLSSFEQYQDDRFYHHFIFFDLQRWVSAVANRQAF